MDEYWQRYRSFWVPVLIGLGVFLVGLIAVHIISPDPDQAESRRQSAARRLSSMQMPEARKAAVLRDRGEALKGDVASWSARLNQTGGHTADVVTAAAEQALRAAVVRGAPEDEATAPARLKARFDDDEVAADLAYKRFRRLLEVHTEKLRSSDPNVAWSGLLSDVWTDLRIRANRADVELGADQLGFDAIGSVSRATLPARVLNLALVARVVDCAIRNGVKAVTSVQVPASIDADSPDDFLALWPVDMVLVGDMAAVKQILDLLTDPQQPVPLEGTRLTPPRQAGKDGEGLVELSVRASSVIVRSDVDLKLDVEEEQ